MADKIKETIIIARGEKTPEDVEVILRFLRSRDLRTEVIDPEDPKDLLDRLITQDRIYSIDEIVDDQQFLAKEHLLEFRRKYKANLHPTIAGIAFGVLVNPTKYGYHTFSSSRRKYARPPLEHIPPEALGLVVQTRESVGLPLPLYTTTNPEVVRVDSFLEFSASLTSGTRPKIIRLTDKTEVFLSDVASHLRNRILSPGVKQ